MPPFSATLVDPYDPTQNITFTAENFEGFAYDDDDTGFQTAMAAVAKTMEYVAKAASTTSHSAVVGSKTFGITGGFGLYVGAPVRMVKSSIDFMEGLVTDIDLSAKTLTVNVTSVSSAFGAHAAWVIGLGSATTAAASSPGTIAQGCTGSGTVAGALANFELKQTYVVSSVLSTPPGSPTNGQRHIASASPTGAWAGHEHEIPNFVTGTGWTFIVPNAGDQAFDDATDQMYVYTAAAQSTDGIYNGSRWKPVTPIMGRWKAASLAASYSVLPTDHGKWFGVSTSSTLNITLPTRSANSGAAVGMAITVEVYASNGAATVIAISGGANIRLENGTEAASITVNSATYRCIHLVCGNTVSSNDWYVWRG